MFDIDFSLIHLGPKLDFAHAGAGFWTANASCSLVLDTDCSAGNSLQLSFWLRLSNSILSDRRDCVAGGAEAKESRVAPLLAQVELRPPRPYFLGFIQDRTLHFTCEVECTHIMVTPAPRKNNGNSSPSRK